MKERERAREREKRNMCMCFKNFNDCTSKIYEVHIIYHIYIYKNTLRIFFKLILKYFNLKIRKLFYLIGVTFKYIPKTAGLLSSIPVSLGPKVARFTPTYDAGSASFVGPPNSKSKFLNK